MCVCETNNNVVVSLALNFDRKCTHIDIYFQWITKTPHILKVSMRKHLICMYRNSTNAKRKRKIGHSFGGRRVGDDEYIYIYLTNKRNSVSLRSGLV